MQPIMIHPRKTFYVTVATSTTDHPYHGTGSSNKYKINGTFSHRI